MIKKVAIVGCGKIFSRHIEAINSSPENYKLDSICDIDTRLGEKLATELNVEYYRNFKDMLNKTKADFYVIATPNYLHFKQSNMALKIQKTILVEKPVALRNSEIESLCDLARLNNTKAYCVLQVRYNPTVLALKDFINRDKLGELRTINLLLNWQRPKEYFESWRGNTKKSGGTLFEVGIHYLDVLQHIFGLPTVISSFKTSHKNIYSKDYDTVYAIVRYPNSATGTISISLAAEPSNVECSVSVTGSKGYIKISGPALNKFDVSNFLDTNDQEEWLSVIKKSTPSLEPNPYGLYKGSSPNHPILYKEIAQGRGFELNESINSVKLIENIYEKSKH